MLQPGLGHVHYEPYGQALILAPWNYPFDLALAPLIGALAAGNVAVLKPSELTPATARLLQSLISDNFPSALVSVVQGPASVAEQLLTHRFDYVFFTGSPRVGQLVAMKAAEHLTPVTLELGGKSPCIVDSSADLATAARRIAWGKFFNLGQTCLAPDFVWVEETVAEQLIHHLGANIRKSYGTQAGQSPDLARIINTQHFDRLTSYLNQGRVRVGGQHDRSSLFIAPTIMDQVAWTQPLMNEEIFGPILPIVPYRHLNEVIEFQQGLARPLAVYMFTTTSAHAQAVTRRLSFGGGCINDVFIHAAADQLPFGGIGRSGMGRYHGHFSFLTFSHQKGILKRTSWPDPDFRYAPYNANKLNWIRRLFS